VDALREMSQQQKIQRAIDAINENLEYFIEKEHMEFLESRIKKRGNGLALCDCKVGSRGECIVLPSVKDTIARLLQEEQIDGERYEKLKKEYKAKVRARYEQKIPAFSKPLQAKELKAEERTQTPPTSPEKSVSHKEKTPEKPKERSAPYLLHRYLHPEAAKGDASEVKQLEKYYKTRETELKLNIYHGKRTLSMYEKLMGPQSALTAYVYHKIIQEANRYRSPMADLLSFDPYSSSREECANFR
jgi:hypothetical protein